MSIEGDVDAGVNLGPLHIHGMAELDAGIQSIVQQLRSIKALEEAYQFGAKDIPLRGSGYSDSGSDSFIINLGGPTYGREWQVRRLTIGGVLWTSTVAGSALVVVGPTHVPEVICAAT